MPKRAATPCAFSVSSLAKRTRVFSSPAACSKAGAIILHGPHHAAQKSTTTGSSLRETKGSNVASSSATGLPSSSGAPHLPHFGSSPSRARGTRFAVRQRGHASRSLSWASTAIPRTLGRPRRKTSLQALVRNLGFDQLRKQDERLLPAEVASLGRNDVG